MAQDNAVSGGLFFLGLFVAIGLAVGWLFHWQHHV